MKKEFQELIEKFWRIYSFDIAGSWRISLRVAWSLSSSLLHSCTSGKIRESLCSLTGKRKMSCIGSYLSILLNFYNNSIQKSGWLPSGPQSLRNLRFGKHSLGSWAHLTICWGAEGIGQDNACSVSFNRPEGGFNKMVWFCQFIFFQVRKIFPLENSQVASSTKEWSHWRSEWF